MVVDRRKPRIFPPAQMIPNLTDLWQIGRFMVWAMAPLRQCVIVGLECVCQVDRLSTGLGASTSREVQFSVPALLHAILRKMHQ